MNHPSIALSLCFLTLFSSSASVATAFNITNILNNFPDFILLNTLLSQTGIAPDINSRSTITILAIDNATASQLTSRPTELLRNILSIHVLLDYFDSIKLRNMRIKRSLDVTTLYQASGMAQGRQGFVNITKLQNNDISFASDVPGSNSDVRLISVLAAQPYNISVLYVSGIVIAPGIDNTLIPSPKRPDPPPAPVPVPPPPSPDEGAADAPVEDSPAESPTTDDKAPSGSPAPAPAPEADSPMEDIAPDVDDGTESDSVESSSSRAQSIVGFAASLVLTVVVMKTIAC